MELSSIVFIANKGTNLALLLPTFPFFDSIATWIKRSSLDYPNSLNILSSLRNATSEKLLEFHSGLSKDRSQLALLCCVLGITFKSSRFSKEIETSIFAPINHKVSRGRGTNPTLDGFSSTHLALIGVARVTSPG